ncbi:MAG: hypothetical protein K0S22_600 [Oscillospiraceae bacterium]|jgi:hypothetical protein|nr:hypothetical protein [Oscillospiraceae bacterium]
MQRFLSSALTINKPPVILVVALRGKYTCKVPDALDRFFNRITFAGRAKAACFFLILIDKQV